MSNNINQAVNAKGLIDLVNINQKKVTTILFTDAKTNEGKGIKKIFIKLSKNFSNCFFIFVDKSKFIDTDGQMSINHKINTYFLIFFNTQKVSVIEGPDIGVCERNINHILKMIHDANNQEQNNDTTDNKEILSEEESHDTSSNDSHHKKHK